MIDVLAILKELVGKVTEDQPFICIDCLMPSKSFVHKGRRSDTKTDGEMACWEDGSYNLLMAMEASIPCEENVRYTDFCQALKEVDKDFEACGCIDPYPNLPFITNKWHIIRHLNGRGRFENPYWSLTRFERLLIEAVRMYVSDKVLDVILKGE